MTDGRRHAIGCLALVLVIIAGGLLDRPAAQTKPEDPWSAPLEDVRLKKG